MPNPAPGIGDVTLTSWDDVNMGVLDRLTGRLAAVDADVQTVDARPCGNLLADPINEREQVFPLFSGQSL